MLALWAVAHPTHNYSWLLDRFRPQIECTTKINNLLQMCNATFAMWMVQILSCCCILRRHCVTLRYILSQFSWYGGFEFPPTLIAACVGERWEWVTCKLRRWLEFGFPYVHQGSLCYIMHILLVPHRPRRLNKEVHRYGDMYYMSLIVTMAWHDWRIVATLFATLHVWIFFIDWDKSSSSIHVWRSNRHKNLPTVQNLVI